MVHTYKCGIKQNDWYLTNKVSLRPARGLQFGPFKKFKKRQTKDTPRFGIS